MIRRWKRDFAFFVAILVVAWLAVIGACAIIVEVINRVG